VRWALALAGTSLLLIVAVAALSGGHSVSPDELARRCAASEPAWNGYQEDIKEIGAGPVARWRGGPVAAVFSGGVLRVEMLLEPPWSDWNAVLPLLLKTPEGQILREAGADRDGPRRTYNFALPHEPDMPLPPWVELQYPHNRKRLHLDGDGNWRAPAHTPGAP